MKQLVEFKYVKDIDELSIGKEIGIDFKDTFILSKEKGHLWFNDVNLSEQYNISNDKVIKDIHKDGDKLIISFTDNSEDKIIDLYKHINDVDGGHELQNIIANKHIKVKNQYQSVVGKDEIIIPKQDILDDYKIGMKGYYKSYLDKYPSGSFLVRTHPTSKFDIQMDDYDDKGIVYFNNQKVEIKGRKQITLNLGEKKEHNILFEIVKGIRFSLYDIDNPYIKHISYIPDKDDKIKSFGGIKNEDVEFEIIGNPTSIGDYAFWGCSGFTGDLIIPEKVTSIGKWAFYECTGFIDELKLPEGLTTIDKYAFYDCSGFTGELIIPENITNIDDMTFYNCSGFTSLKLPEGLITINKQAFFDCLGFTGELIIPENVTNIGDGAFYGCKNLTKAYVCEDTTLGANWIGNTSAKTIIYKKGETPWIKA